MYNNKYNIATAILLTSCTSYYKGVVTSVDTFNLKATVEVTPTHLIEAEINIKDLDSLKKGQGAYVDKKTLRLFLND